MIFGKDHDLRQESVSYLSVPILSLRNKVTLRLVEGGRASQECFDNLSKESLGLGKWPTKMRGG